MCLGVKVVLFDLVLPKNWFNYFSNETKLRFSFAVFIFSNIVSHYLKIEYIHLNVKIILMLQGIFFIRVISYVHASNSKLQTLL